MSNNDDLGVKERIKARLLEATTEDELRQIRHELKDEGERPGSIDACVSELKKKGFLRFDGKAAAISKSQPLETLIANTRLPAMVAGAAPVFDAGVQYGMKCILVGVRVAQELSAMGVQQASPIIQMAREMRESEGQAAREVAADLAQATLQANQELREEIRNISVAQSPNPMMALMSQTMQPYFSQAIGSVMKMFGLGAMGQSGQPQTPVSQPIESGFQEMTDEERTEIFGGE